MSALLVVGFYFACWSPYWGYQLVTVFLVSAPSTTAGVAVALCFHSLPYANSALNWIFYAYLNENLRENQRVVAEKGRQNQPSQKTIEEGTLHSRLIKHMESRAMSLEGVIIEVDVRKINTTQL